MNRMSRRTLGATMAAAAGLALTLPKAARSQEVVLSAVSAFADGTLFTRNFESFVAEANRTGEGLIRIDYKGGGGKVIDPFQLGDAVRSGVVQIANLPSAVYTRLVPEADAIKLSNFTITEERQNGAWAYMNDLHMAKMNFSTWPGRRTACRSTCT